MENNKKIIKAITTVVVQTMYQHGTSFKSEKSKKDATKKIVKAEVRKLYDADELDYSDIVDKVTREMLAGIKEYK